MIIAIFLKILYILLSGSHNQFENNQLELFFFFYETIWSIIPFVEILNL